MMQQQQQQQQRQQEKQLHTAILCAHAGAVAEPNCA
jgi:hypothetical protein